MKILALLISASLALSMGAMAKPAKAKKAAPAKAAPVMEKPADMASEPAADTYSSSSSDMKMGVGLLVGYAKLEDIDGAFTYGARFDYMNTFGVDVANWSKEEKGTILATSYTISYGQFQIKPWYHYNFNAGNIQPFVGTGLSLNIFSAKASMAGVATATDSETEIGIHATGGVKGQMTDVIGWFAQGDFGLILADETVNFITLIGGATYRF